LGGKIITVSTSPPEIEYSLSNDSLFSAPCSAVQNPAGIAYSYACYSITSGMFVLSASAEEEPLFPEMSPM